VLEVRPGRAADYNEVRRAAIARSLPPYPPAELAAPVVEKGALVIVGGGGMPADVTKKFVELGGGENGLFVIFPTAMPDPLPDDSGAAFLKRYGAKNIVVISAREQNELEEAKNLETLSKATAIWFGGGRQWRFVDAYEGTRLHDLMKGVLARGGVIGGSSAGATIQGDYLVRGAPAGPHIMMCEGYERGLGFLPGVAIDQHFRQRNRFADMTALMKAYPQYLGIGLDEATAIVVSGHTAEIMGRGEVHFYDRNKPVEDGRPDHESFKAGVKYDLKGRKQINDQCTLVIPSSEFDGYDQTRTEVLFHVARRPAQELHCHSRAAGFDSPPPQAAPC
jgi:cyanophycinase